MSEKRKKAARVAKRSVVGPFTRAELRGAPGADTWNRRAIDSAAIRKVAEEMKSRLSEDTRVTVIVFIPQWTAALLEAIGEEEN